VRPLRVCVRDSEIMPTDDQIVVEYLRLIHDVEQLSETVSDDRAVSARHDNLVHVLQFVGGWSRHIGYFSEQCTCW
jgi:hypothetical protein